MAAFAFRDTKSRLFLLHGLCPMQPDILLSVSYRDVRRGQLRGAKLSEQCSLALKGGAQTARRGCDCQHQGGRELGLDRMLNICELLIKRRQAE